MGQLEKYGLYVLCLLIFLIAGVSIWGSVDQPGLPQKTPPLTAPANFTGSGASGSGGLVSNETRELGKGSAASHADIGGSLDSLFQTVQPPPSNQTKPKPAPVVANAELTGSSKDGSSKDGAKDGSSKSGSSKDKDVPAPPVAVHATYKVKAGDTFDSIARTQLGDSRLASAIAKSNPNVKPTKMGVGTVLELPSVDSKTAASNGTASKKAVDDKGPVASVSTSGTRIYTIRKGDNLERIARAELGSSKRVDELKSLNPGIEPTKLQLNQKIQLPAK